MGIVKRENYIQIQGFMLTDLHLSGNELLIYAIIYGFSQTGEGVFDGSREYLAEWCNASLSSIKRSLKALQEKGLIKQIFHSKDNLTVKYKAYIEPQTEMTQGSGQNDPRARVKMTQGSGQNDPRLGSNCPKARVKMTQAYNDDNIAYKLDDKLEDNIVCVETTPKRTRFQKPTLEEVKEYATRNGEAVTDPERFFEYYNANGWKVGKNQMKDWRAAFRMWESKDKTGTPSRRTGSRTQPAEIPYMENEYTPEHLEKREADSLALLDHLLEE